MIDIIDDFIKNKKEYLLRVVGVPKDMDDYFDTINNIIDNPNIEFVFENLINQDIDLINNIKNIIPEYTLKDLSDGFLVKKLDSIKFFDFINDANNKTKVKKSVDRVFKYFHDLKLLTDKNSDSVKITTSKNFLASLLAFLKQYIKNKDYSNNFSLFLGEYKKNDEYIMQILQELGCKVIYFNGENDLFYFKNGIYLKLDKIMFLNKYIKEEEKTPTNMVIESVDIINDLKDSFKSKTDIYKDGEKTIIPHYFQIITGVRNDDEETVYQYLNTLLDSRNELKTNPYFTFINFDLKMNTLDSNKTYIKKVEQLLGEDFSINNLINNIDECGIVLNADVSAYIKKTLKKFIILLNEYCKSKDIKNIYEHINDIFVFIRKNITRINNVLKEKQVYLCYGNLNDVSNAFIYFLSISGFSVFYFSLDKKVLDNIKIMEKSGEISYKTEYTKSVENIDFPNEKLVSRRTVAYVASQEINKMMSNDQIGIFKPYQLNDKLLVNGTLILTYDEINILLKENSMMRPNFSYDNKNIYMPNIFAKVNGVDGDINTYLSSIENSKNLPNSYFICTNKSANTLFSLKITNTLINKQILEKNGMVSFEKLSMTDYYKYNHIRLTSQHLFVEKINQLIFSKDTFLFDMTYDNIMEIINVILNIQMPNIGEMLHTFDYASNIPKIIIFNNIALNNTDAKNLSIFLAFVNALGFDVVMYSPTGYIDIEKYLKDTIFSQHTLANMNTTIEYKKPSKRSKGFFW